MLDNELREEKKNVMAECIEDAESLLRSRPEWTVLASNPVFLAVVTIAFWLDKLEIYKGINFRNQLSKMLNEASITREAEKKQQEVDAQTAELERIAKEKEVAVPKARKSRKKQKSDGS